MKNIIYGILGGFLGAAFMVYMFVGAVMKNTTYALSGIVLEQTYEGWSEYNDYYIISYEDGSIHEIEADDLNEGDHVVTWFHGNEAFQTRYIGH